MYNYKKVMKVEITNNVFMDLDALRATRIYAETAMDYAVYQSFFNLSSMGFGKREWRDVIDNNAVMDRFKSLIADYMKLYSNAAYRFIKNSIRLPYYRLEDMKIMDDGKKLSIVAKGDREFIVSNIYNNDQEFVVLKDDSLIDRDYGFSIYGFIEQSKNVINDLKSLNCNDLKEGEVVMDDKSDGYRIYAVVFDKKENPCSARINVSIVYGEGTIIIADKEEYRIINPFLNFTAMI